MAHPHEDLVRRGDEALARGDMETFWGDVSDDVVVHAAGNSRLAGDYQGKEEAQRTFGRYIEALGENPEIETHDVLANDEHAVQLQVIRARKADRSIEIRTINVMHFRDGKISEFWTVDLDQDAADRFYDA
jgi:uncharacterized protein